MRPSGWRLVWAGLAGQRAALVLVMLWSAVEALPAFLSGAVVARCLDQGFLAGRPGLGLAWLGVLAAVMLVSGFGTRALFPWLAVLIEGLRDRLVGEVTAGTLRRAVAGVERPDSAVVARLTEQVETVRRLTAALLRTLRQLAAAMVASVLGVATLAPVLGLLVGPPLLVALGLFAWLLRPLRARRRDLVLADEAVARQTGAVLGGLRDVVACRARGRAAADVDEAVARQARAARALAVAGSGRILVVLLGGHLPLVAVLAVGPWLVRTGRLTAGELVGAVTYLAVNLQPALRSLVHTVGSWGLQLDVVLGRLFDMTRVPVGGVPAAASRPGGGHVVCVPAGTGQQGRHDLRAVSVTFSYGGRARPVVRDLDLHIAEGEHVTVVGPSGAGKSTLAALLTGLLRPQHGQVLLGRTPLTRLDPAELRRVVAFIPQEAYVFAGTLRENLTYLHPRATSSELDTAVAALGLEPLVARLGGYGAPVRAAALSGGERQLVALARAYLSAAGVVVLDEATSLLDPAAEARVEAGFAARGGTLVVIAHRMSSALRADRVVLLDSGRVWVGTHADLVADCPLYAELLGYWQDAASPAVGGAVPGAGGRPVAGATLDAGGADRGR